MFLIYMYYCIVLQDYSVNEIVELPIIFTFLSDWACGGQWNRMVQFLAVLIQTVQTNHIELAIFFNGCLEQQRMAEWVASQQEVRKKINQVQVIP
jgi:hypothetical protein